MNKMLIWLIIGLQLKFPILWLHNIMDLFPLVPQNRPSMLYSILDLPIYGSLHPNVKVMDVSSILNITLQIVLLIKLMELNFYQNMVQVLLVDFGHMIMLLGLVKLLLMLNSDKLIKWKDLFGLQLNSMEFLVWDTLLQPEELLLFSNKVRNKVFGKTTLLPFI